MESNPVVFRRPKLPRQKGPINAFFGKIKEALITTCNEYFAKTKVSGLWCLQGERIKGIQRYIYISFIIIFLGFGLFLSFVLWLKFYSSPTIVTISQGLPAREIAFPAITLCSVDTIIKSKLISFMDSAKLPPRYRKDEIYVAMQAIGAFTSFAQMPNLTHLAIIQEILDLNNITHSEAMLRISMNCSDVLQKCFWSEKEFPCFQNDRYLTFKTSMSYMGVCCSFNYNPHNEKYIPFGVNAFGYSSGLALTGNLDFFGYGPEYNGRTSGLLLFANHPNDFTVQSSPMVTLRPNVESHVVIHLTELTSSKDTLSLSTEKRNCLIGSDTNEPRYRQPTCRLRCKREAINSFCGCIPYQLFLGDDDHEMRLCNITEADCFIKNLAKIVSFKCEHCLPSCYDINYDISTFSINLVDISETLSNIYSSENLQFVVRVYLGSQDVPSSRKIVIMSWTNLLGWQMNIPILHLTISTIFSANIGGAISLCLGLSAISCVELLYFFTIRLYKNYFKG